MTYEYKCDECAAEFEAQQSINDVPLKRCRSCGLYRLRRLISGSGVFVLKGTGWFDSGGY